MASIWGIRRVPIAVLAATFLALSCLLPTVSASASPASTESLARSLLRSTVARFPKGPTAEFHLKAPGGYRVQVSGMGPFVSLSVRKGFALSSYTARGFVGPHRIRAHFADLGDISVRFKASGRVSGLTLPEPSCRTTTRWVSHHGAFSGEIRFAGENDFLDLDAHHARGALVTPETVKCAHAKAPSHHRHHARHHRQRPKSAVLQATAKSPEIGATKFFSIEAPPGLRGEGFGFAFAFVSEMHASVDILRTALGLPPIASFSFDDALSSAQVTMSTPFSGTGAFQRNADGSSSWTGSLSASFPGVESMPLTGPEWQAQLKWHRSEGGSVVVVGHR